MASQVDTCDRLTEELGEPVERLGVENESMESAEKYYKVGEGKCGESRH